VRVARNITSSRRRIFGADLGCFACFELQAEPESRLRSENVFLSDHTNSGRFGPTDCQVYTPHTGK
jgi:hypothetical protein